MNISPIQLYVGFSLINIPDLKTRVENKRDAAILEIMIYFKKIAVNFITNITEEDLQLIISQSNKALNSIKAPYIDFIVGSVLISSNLIELNEKEKDIERFINITSVFYDLYCEVIKDIEEEKIKDLYKNSFNVATELKEILGKV